MILAIYLNGSRALTCPWPAGMALAVDAEHLYDQLAALARTGRVLVTVMRDNIETIVTWKRENHRAHN